MKMTPSLLCSTILAICLQHLNQSKLCHAFTAPSSRIMVHTCGGAWGSGIESPDRCATRRILYLSSKLSGDDDVDNDDGNDDTSESSSTFNTTQLSDRISQMQKYESEQSSRFTSGLQQRIEELQSSTATERQFETSGVASIPVITFDAMLPNQTMEGSTQDPTFMRLLMDVGLGGWFGVTSLDFRSRKIRRNGVLCKIKFLDAAKKKDQDRLPTSVDFVISAKKRCRVIGRSEALKLRIGRWRRIYDENGEEALLGWGEERFLDLGQPTKSEERQENLLKDSTQWSLTDVECNLDGKEKIQHEMIEKAESLLPLIDEWYDLASDTRTYHNVNVTASTRVRKGHPYLSVEPDKLLQRVRKELGERPPADDPSALAFWAAALINPLPPLGVSLEIRGRMLEAACVEERLNVLELGLRRSIQNLNGDRPL